MLGANRRIFTGGKFAVEAVFRIPGGEPVTLRGVFDDAFYEAQLGESRLDGSIPRLTVREEETVGIVRETPVTIDGKYYSVLEVQPDLGTGLAVIELAHEQPLEP